MATKTFQAFTEGTILSPTDYLVGYAHPSSGGERKWRASLLSEYLDQSLGNQFWKVTAWVSFNGITQVNQAATIHSSYNVSSVKRILDSSAIDTLCTRFEITFAPETMRTNNYTVVGLAQVGNYESSGNESETNDQLLGVYSTLTNVTPPRHANGTTSSCIVSVYDANNRAGIGSYQRSGIISVAFFGGI